MRVVDRDDKGISAAEDRQRGQERAGRRQRLGRLVCLPKQQRNFECLPLLCRQGIADLVKDAANEVAEGSEREVGLSLGRPCLEHPISSLMGRADRLEHDGRLAHAGLAFDQKPDGPGRHLLRESRHGRRLSLASDHVDHGCTLEVAAVGTHPRGAGFETHRECFVTPWRTEP